MELIKDKTKFTENYKIHDERNKVIVEYTQGRSGRIRSDFKREQAVAKDYRGREIIELLQNAEDAANEDERTVGNGKVVITLKEGRLIIENTGKPFDFNGVHSIMLADDSPKNPQLRDVIGNKGLGFRSILSWAETIRISSSKVCVEFSQNAVALFEKEIIEKKPELTEELLNTPISVLSAPIILDDGEHDSIYDTKIEIICKNKLNDEYQVSVIDTIKKQINEMVQANVLLFLRNIKELVINIENEDTRHYIKEVNFEMSIDESFKKSNIRLSVLNKNLMLDYCLYTAKNIIKVYDEKKAKDQDKKIFFGLAIQLNNVIKNHNLYSFFRTKIVNPFKFLLNASLELSQNRNNLIQDDLSNQKAIDQLIDFIFMSLEDFTSAQKDDQFSMIKLLAISDFKNFLEEYNFPEKFLQKLKLKHILPNVNGSFISIVNKVNDVTSTPIMNMEFAKNVSGSYFDELIAFTDDKEVIDFLKFLNIKSYKEYDINFLFNKINKYILSIQFKDENERIRYLSLLIKLIYNEFGRGIKYPSLFINSKNQIVNSTHSLYIIEDNENNLIKIPEWLEFEFASQEQLEILCELFETDLKKFVEIFSNSPYKFLNFQQIFEAISRKFDEDISMEEIIKIHKWLFSQYKTYPEKFKINVQFLKTKVIYGKKENMSVGMVNEVYFPDHYDNAFIYNLLKTSKCKFLVGKSIYGLNGTDKEIIEYFRLLGVNKYPREIQFIPDDNTFKDIFMHLKGYTKVYDYLQEKHPSGYLYNINTTIKISSVEHIEHIIKQPFNQIICFLHLLEKENKVMFDKLIDKSKGNKDSIIFRYSYSRSPYLQENAINFNYLEWFMRNSTWVDYRIDNKKYKTSPILCSFDNIKVHGFLEDPYWNIKEIQKDNKDITDLQIKSILEKLGAINDLGDLSISKMYKLLDILPKIDPDCVIARRVYEKIFDSIKIEESLYDESYNYFITNGKVSSIKNKVKKYFPINEVNYTDNKTLSDEILDDINLFDFPYRKGAKKVNTIFGVNKLNSEKVKISDEQIKYHYINNEFQNFFKQLKPYIVVKRRAVFSKGKDADLLKNSDIFIVQSLTVEYQLSDIATKKYDLCDYSFVWISKEKKGYIVVPPNIFENGETLFRNTQFADSLAELICLILTVYDGKESYRELIKDLDNREYLLEKDLGPNAMIMLNEVRRDYGIIVSKKEVFYNTLKSISNKKYENAITDINIFDEREFDFENLNSQNNFKQIIKLFNYLKIDIDKFNSNNDIYKINIENYHREQFQKRLIDLKPQYKTYILNSALNIPTNERLKTYLDALNRYIFNGRTFPNSINVNYDLEFEKQTLIKPTELPTAIDFSEIIDTNLLEFSKLNELKFNEIKKMPLNDYENYALLNILDIYYETKIWSNVPSQVKTNNTQTAKINFNELISNVDQSSISSTIKIANIEKGITKESIPQNNLRSSENNFGLTNEALKQENGFIAEYYAYKKLISSYGIENVNWVSKNSTYVFSDKTYNDGLHYDISYVEKEIEQYVEVKKVSIDNLSFDISKSEVEFGESNKDKYHIYCVAVEDKKPIDGKSVLIKNFFSYAKNEAFTHNNKFNVVSNSFKIKAKVK